MSHRIEKINSLIQKNISEIFAKELSLQPGVFLTVSKVDTSKDLRYTRVFLSIFPVDKREYVEKTLKKEMYHIQGAFGRIMKVKIIPKIEFIIDKQQDKIEEIEKIFNEIEEGRSEEEKI